MKRTIIEEYDDNGKLLKKTITEEDTTYWPWWGVCACGQTAACPLHPYGVKPWYVHTISASDTATVDKVHFYNT